MSPVDAAWYHMDGPANLAVVTGALLTRKKLDFDEVREVYRSRLLRFERFRQRVVEKGFPLATPHWEDMPNFDINQHMHHIALAAPHDEAALRSLISDLASTPLDHQQPLWHVYVVDDVAGGSALIMRCHHCVADGTAMMTVARELFDTGPGGPTPSGVPRRIPGSEPTAAERLLAMADTAVEVVTHPGQVIEKAAVVAAGAGMLVRELLRWPDPQSPLKGEFALRKQVAWSRPVTIKDVKTIGARHGAKVNDVLVACMTGALRSYLKKRGVDVNHTTVRAMVPVDLRPPQRAGELGNEFGLVILDLAVTSARATQRLAITKKRMDELKRSPEAMATKLLFEIFGRGPKALEDFANELFGSKASIVMTNVMGPRDVLYLTGVPIDRMIAWAPHPGKELGMAISIMSYHGKASLTIGADARLVPDPEVITELFNREFQTLLRAAKTPRVKVTSPSPREKKASPRTAVTHPRP